MDAAITELEMNAGDGAVGFIFVMKPDYWKHWMDNWTRAVANVEADGPILDEWEDTVVRWGDQVATEMQNP